MDRAGKAPSGPLQDKSLLCGVHLSRFNLPVLTLPLLSTQVTRVGYIISRSWAQNQDVQGGMQAVNIGLYNEMMPLQCLWPIM